MADDRSSPARLVSALAAMTAVMLLVAALGEWLLLPSATVRDLDEGGVARGVGLLTTVPGLESVALLWSDLTQPWVVHTLVLVVALLLLARGRVSSRALLVVPISLVGWTLEAVCKVLVERPRPAEAVVEVGSWSYPSGHATNAALGAVLLITLVTTVRSAWVRWGATTLVVIGAVLTAADRVVLGVHYPGDVLSGLLLGTVLGLIGVWGLAPTAHPPLESRAG
ncbi:phosphatase PAP2 family protein [Janibacter alittae]|uniref:Phosphatase PAP2 family protein n=1 Tax=Janibacter alittae TaxID=3115209 RepID=A0ABZ2MG75_9MICO